MKRLLFVLLPLIAILGYVVARHFHQHAMVPYLIAEPDPVLTTAELASDQPPDAAFDTSGWKAVTDLQAEAFSYLDEDHRCNTAWRDMVSEKNKTARIEASNVTGKLGLVVWHRMRIMEADGTRSAMLERPGPRIAGQTTIDSPQSGQGSVPP